MKAIYQNKSGFTMVEILVAVIIIITLVVMAVPLYDRAIEKSRIGEASITLKRIGEAKVRAMNNRDIAHFQPGDFTINELDVNLPKSEDWQYGIYNSQSTYNDAVCAIRNKGKNKNKITLLYLGEVGEDICKCDTTTYSSQVTVCGAFCNDGVKLFCRQTTPARCEAYGMDNFSFSPDCYNGLD